MIKVGQKLKEARLKKRFTLEDVAKATKIKISFLSSIEKGQYEDLPSSTYAQGFVRNYIKFLDLPTEETLALFRREFNEEKFYKVLPEGLSSGKEFPLKRIKIQDTFKIIIIVFVLLLAFILFQYRNAFIDPSLEIYSPKEAEVFSSQKITVSGKTSEGSVVFINNIPSSIDKDGKFTKTINVFTGEETIVVKTINSFKRQKIIQRQISVRQ